MKHTADTREVITAKAPKWLESAFSKPATSEQDTPKESAKSKQKRHPLGFV